MLVLVLRAACVPYSTSTWIEMSCSLPAATGTHESIHSWPLPGCATD